jgi:hypothetical protein
VGLTALLTDGEKGDPIVTLLGDCAIAVPARNPATELGVTIGWLPFVMSTFVGMSTWSSTVLVGASAAGDLVGQGGGSG